MKWLSIITWLIIPASSALNASYFHHCWNNDRVSLKFFEGHEKDIVFVRFKLPDGSDRRISGADYIDVDINEELNGMDIDAFDYTQEDTVGIQFFAPASQSKAIKTYKYKTTIFLHDYERDQISLYMVSCTARAMSLFNAIKFYETH
ncbi:MAG TPA: hypothetical protein VEL47_03795 [Myxococcota bacterium]|nr:hypothetical protein [Myxococcota bacterium]